jgi:hypothetical protein
MCGHGVEGVQLSPARPLSWAGGRELEVGLGRALPEVSVPFWIALLWLVGTRGPLKGPCVARHTPHHWRTWPSHRTVVRLPSVVSSKVPRAYLT